MKREDFVKVAKETLDSLPEESLPFSRASISFSTGALIICHLPRHGTAAANSGGLGLAGINSFAPNDLSLHLFTVWPFNE